MTGFDGLPQAWWAGYDLTALVQPIDVLVRRAVDLLLDPTDGGPVEVAISGALRVGSTPRDPGLDPVTTRTNINEGADHG